MDLDDLEAEMADDEARQARTARARARVAAFNAQPADAQARQLLRRPGYDIATRRTVRLSGQTGLAAHLLNLENEVIDQLHPDDRHRYRRTQ